VIDEDLELVERFQCGDITAFELLVNKYQNKIYEISYRHTRNAEDAYDLSQEVFEKVFKFLRSFKRKSSFYTWLYRIAVNACIDYNRKKSRSQSVPIEEWVCSYDSSVTTTNYSPARALELKELRHQIAKAIDQLPPKQKTVFILKRQEGLSLKEISRILGRSEGTIKAHLFHATHKLMELLSPYLENKEVT
jgi:RNA polymerase sigma-70 factor (ECF subfamily)